MTDSVTARLIARLPETLWPEAVRRLRRVPALWALAQNDEVLQAFVEQTDAPRPLSRKLPPVEAFDTAGAAYMWRPGPLALAAFAVLHPECQGKAERWLLGAGRESVGAGYARLTGEGAGLHPIDEAVPAAVALRLRMVATVDWAALAAEAVKRPDLWRLPLQYLWGLAADGHGDFFTGLVKAGPEGATLAAQVAAVNLSPDETVAFVKQLNLDLPRRQWMALAQALEAMGEAACARAILRPHAQVAANPSAERKALTAGWNPLEINLNAELEQALLAAATEDYALAQPMLNAAWNQARQLRATVAAHLGRLALAAGELVVAQAGFEDALAEQPEDAGLRAALAETLVRLDRSQEALALLENQGQPVPLAQLAAAEAHARLEQPEQARAALAGLAQTVPGDTQPSVLSQAAHLAHRLGDTATAAQLMLRAAQSAATEAGYYHAAAQWLLETGSTGAAREMAIEAAALSPSSAEVRETLGLALLADGDAALAVPHFQAAVAFEPKRVQAALGLARAALAANQPKLASEAAESILKSLPAHDGESAGDQALRGEAHTLLGQALGDLDQAQAAFDHFHRASVLVPTAPAPWRAMAKHLRSEGEPARALATLEAGRQALSLAASPKSAPLLSDLAEAYYANGRLTEAILALREAVTADPQAFAEQRRLGGLLRQQGAVAEAVGVLRKALQLQPADGPALYELGQALEKLGRIEEAWAAYQQTVLTRPTRAEPYLDLGRLTLQQCAAGALNASPLQAVAALRSAIELAPDEAEAHGLLAQAQHLAGDPQGALESYQQALHLAPTRTDWSLGLGQVCLDLKQPHVAVACLTEALEHAPDDPTVHAAIARAYGLSQLWREARHSADAALRLDPENASLMQLLAEAEARLGDHAAALKAWRRAVAANPRDAAMQVRLAQCLMDMGDVAEARSVFAQALALAPDSAAVHLAAGEALAHLGELDEAQRVLSQAVDMDPHSAEIQAAYGRVAAQLNQYEAAHAAFLHAAEIESGRGRELYLREAGEALWAMNRPAAAIAVWQRALVLNGQNYALRGRLGLALLQLGQAAEALTTLEQALAANPRDALLMREAARAALALGKLDRAAEYLQQAVETGPGDAEARYMLGEVREKQGQIEPALTLYRQATRINPGEGRYVAAIANSLAALGNTSEAVKVMESALKISPDQAEVQQWAGELYLRVKRPGEAVRAFQQCGLARPRDPHAQLALARALVITAEAQEHTTRSGMKLTAAESIGDAQAQIAQALQHAAALGADPVAVRYWLARAKAAAGDPREAQRLLESIPPAKISAVGGSLPELFRALGVSLRKSGQLERARAALHAALQHEGDHAASHIEMGLVEWAAGDQNGALSAFKRAVAAAPDEALAHFHLAEALFALGQDTEAEQVLQKALALRPDVAAWHHRLARVHHQRRAKGLGGDTATALAHFQRAAELEPDHADYLADLARALARDGDLTTAAEHYRRATEAAVGDALLWTERGQIELALHDHKLAADCFAHALKLAPGSAPALLGAAQVSLALGELHEAANRAEAAVRASPDDADALVCLADVQLARGDNAAAERHYLAAAAKTSQPGAALHALGRLYSRQGKWERAAEALEKAAAANPESDEVFAALGEAQYAAGNFAGSVKSFREAARIAPRVTAHLLRLGRSLRSQGQLDQALSHLLQAREMAPKDDEILRELGQVFDQRKQFDRALEMYRQALDLQPKSAANHTRLGVALKNMKNYPEAVIALERAVNLDPKNLEATKQLAVVTAMNIVQASTRPQPVAGR